MDIFERLNKSRVCYAVGIAKSTFVVKGVASNPDYFILIHKDDEKKLNRVGLHFLSSKQKHCKECTIKGNNVEIFKSMQKKFVKVVHTKDGRIYELKRNSFKEKYEAKCKN